ncbi:hypothetical protein BOTBODRAFT_186567 [Botryobasidium botryosum FD-172 SS1]|uniref:Uncharacterized protein n=1 Tax=Botryobasidium botryosum (strain FD-172 SS1) TaxID=930990 RepID=A0A067MXE4_BOTB1|nr:hypothetical protein BOTBODRAFT_186567 [Botryobasidium botryosum FD-172 SS1]
MYFNASAALALATSALFSLPTVHIVHQPGPDICVAPFFAVAGSGYALSFFNPVKLVPVNANTSHHSSACPTLPIPPTCPTLSPDFASPTPTASLLDYPVLATPPAPVPIRAPVCKPLILSLPHAFCDAPEPDFIDFTPSDLLEPEIDTTYRARYGFLPPPYYLHPKPSATAPPTVASEAPALSGEPGDLIVWERGLGSVQYAMRCWTSTRERVYCPHFRPEWPVLVKNPYGSRVSFVDLVDVTPVDTVNITSSEILCVFGFVDICTLVADLVGLLIIDYILVRIRRGGLLFFVGAFFGQAAFSVNSEAARRCVDDLDDDDTVNTRVSLDADPTQVPLPASPLLAPITIAATDLTHLDQASTVVFDLARITAEMTAGPSSSPSPASQPLRHSSFPSSSSLPSLPSFTPSSPTMHPLSPRLEGAHTARLGRSASSRLERGCFRARTNSVQSSLSPASVSNMRGSESNVVLGGGNGDGVRSDGRGV